MQISVLSGSPQAHPSLLPSSFVSRGTGFFIVTPVISAVDNTVIGEREWGKLVIL